MRMHLHWDSIYLKNRQIILSHCAGFKSIWLLVTPSGDMKKKNGAEHEQGKEGSKPMYTRTVVSTTINKNIGSE